MELAKLLSKLSIAVADLGNLKIPTGWKPGEYGAVATGYRKLEKSDFKNAAENVTEILMTFYKPMKTLGNDPEYMKTIGDQNMIGDLFVSSPWSRIINRNLKLAALLTKLANAVSDVANLKIAKTWQKGEYGPEATSWRAMTCPCSRKSDASAGCAPQRATTSSHRGCRATSWLCPKAR